MYEIFIATGNIGELFTKESFPDEVWNAYVMSNYGRVRRGKGMYTAREVANLVANHFVGTNVKFLSCIQTVLKQIVLPVTLNINKTTPGRCKVSQ